MKNLLKLLILSVILLAFLTCASSDATQGSERASEGSLTLDAAITEAAVYFTQRFPQGAKLALVHFDAPAGKLSDYVFEEMWTRFEDSQKFVMVDRRNLDRIDTEIRRQYESGKVDDAAVISMTKQYGAEVLVYGQINAMGRNASEYRMTVYATDVEKAQSSQRAFIIRQDSRLASLLSSSPDEEVERALSIMAQAVGQRTLIAMGRISYADTQTVSNLSAWLKNSIITGAQKHQNSFQIATENQSADFAVSSRGLTVETPVVDSPVQAVIVGSFSPLDNDAEVSLSLISTGANRAALASARFVIPAAELERRRLSMFPDKDSAFITKAEFETKQQAIAPYSGSANKWTFTVTPDVLDGIYYNDDFMTMRIYSERDCYFRIIHVDVNGQTQVIYPLSPNDNNFIRAGQTRRIPDNTRFRMTPPFGEELILVSAYEQPFTSSQQSGTLSADSITRGLVVESNNRASINPSVTARFSYTVLPR
ncbi:MAG: DUF4384 domain-containing protein [Treponema sp.]|jgi:hypothetical protein|nr:DUF4384 domain-containing protein [Treponema sp.]